MSTLLNNNAVRVNERESNIEILRIIAMLMIVLLHANYASLGEPNRNDILTAPFSSFWRVFSEQLCIVGVNVFVLISGWFGIKPSTKGLCSIVFQVLFWGILIFLLGIGFKLDIPYNETAKVFWFGSYYWFIIAYVVLYILSPVLNAFIEKASPKQFITVLIGSFSSEFIYGWIVFSEEYNQGYTVVSFISLYLLARFIRLYSTKLKSTKAHTCILLYGLFSLIPAFVSFVGIKNGWKTLHPIYYSSPFVISAAVFFFLFFSKLSFKSKAVNWMACSTFSVYLIHLHPIVFPYFLKATQYLSGVLSTFSYTCTILILAITLLLTCVVFDKLRIIIWKFLCSHGFDKMIHGFEAAYEKVLDRMGYRS